MKRTLLLSRLKNTGLFVVRRGQLLEKDGEGEPDKVANTKAEEQSSENTEDGGTRESQTFVTFHGCPRSRESGCKTHSDLNVCE